MRRRRREQAIESMLHVQAAFRPAALRSNTVHNVSRQSDRWPTGRRQRHRNNSNYRRGGRPTVQVSIGMHRRSVHSKHDGRLGTFARSRALVRISLRPDQLLQVLQVKPKPCLSASVSAPAHHALVQSPVVVAVTHSHGRAPVSQPSRAAAWVSQAKKGLAGAHAYPTCRHACHRRPRRAHAHRRLVLNCRRRSRCRRCPGRNWIFSQRGADEGDVGVVLAAGPAHSLPAAWATAEPRVTRRGKVGEPQAPLAAGLATAARFAAPLQLSPPSPPSPAPCRSRQHVTTAARMLQAVAAAGARDGAMQPVPGSRCRLWVAAAGAATRRAC